MTSPQDPGSPPEGSTPQDPYQPPQQPPPYGYWPYPQPPPARSNTWAWVSLALGLVVALLLVVVVGIGWFWTSWGAYDDYDSSGGDSYYYADQGRVSNAMERVCDTLGDAAAEVQIFGSVDAGQASVSRLADAARDMSSAIEGARPNKDAKKLSADWSSLATALDTFAAALADDPKARFTMPETDGDYVSDRILWGNDTCYVPTIVLALDSEAADSSDGPFAY